MKIFLLKLQCLVSTLLNNQIYTQSISGQSTPIFYLYDKPKTNNT